MNYTELKTISKQFRGHKVTVKDLVALAPQNDPFYVGTEGDLTNGTWFAELWERFEYTDHIHLRRVHYQIISQETPILMPNGKLYENTIRCWEFLGIASKAARYLGFVNPEAFVDRRNPDPVIYTKWTTYEPEIEIVDALSVHDFDFPDFLALPTYRISRDYWTDVSQYQGQQRYHLEIWCEKSTMNDVLERVCSAFKANLVTGVGEQSITSTLELVHRANRSTRPVRVFYVSDFDPAGKSMPVAVSRKAEYYIRKRYPDMDFRLFPVVLTEDQVRDYHLPRTPIKESERRRNHFEEVYGEGAVELDALEALHPGVLYDILKKHIQPYYDDTLHRRVWEEEGKLKREMTKTQQAIFEKHQEEIDELRAHHEQISQEFQERIASHYDQIQELWQAITDELEPEKPDIDEYPIPEAKDADEIGDGLYNSQRSYLEQLKVYKQFQGKLNGNLSHLTEEMFEEALVQVEIATTTPEEPSEHLNDVEEFDDHEREDLND